MPTKIDPNELLEVVWAETGEKVSLPRRLLTSGNKAAQLRHLVSTAQLSDPVAPPLPAPVEAVIEEVQAEQADAQQQQVEALREQLNAIQSQLDGQPLSYAELVAARQEITGLMLKAADAGAQLVQVEGRGSQIKADLSAIATPLQEQAAETARQQQENNEVQQRVLGALQEQASATLASLQQQGAAALAEVESDAQATAQTVARSEASRVAREVASRNRGASTVITLDDPANTDQASFAQRWIGDDRLIDGDGALFVTKSGVQVYRFAGGDWKAGPLIEPKAELVSQPLSISDQSVRSLNTIVNQVTGGGGGSGGLEKLVTAQSNGSNFVTLGDSSNWSAAGFKDPRSGHLWLEVLDPNTAESGVLSCVFDAGIIAGNTRITVYAISGPVFDRGTIQLELDAIRIGAPIIPATLTAQGITAAPGAGGATQLRLRLWDTVTNPIFLYRGGVGWLFKSEETVRLPSDPTPLSDSPLWIWS